MWPRRKIFPNARVVGFDIDETSVAQVRADSDPLLDAYLVDSTLPTDVARVLGDVQGRGSHDRAARPPLGAARFDLVVDDGFHTLDAQIATLTHLFPFVRHGGLYVIEDIGDTWRFALQNDRARLTSILGRSTPYFFVDNFRHQTATTSVSVRPPLSMLVITRPLPGDTAS